MRPHEVYVWYFPTTGDVGALVTAAGLTADEEGRCARYQHDDDRRGCLAVRALARLALAHHAGVPARDWRFDRAAGGKPLALPPATGGKAPRFNVAHTRGLVAVVVAHGREVGVDVESVDGRARDRRALARRHFAPDEAAALEALPADEQPGAFLRLWTLKEAFLKACGDGLARAGALGAAAFPEIPGPGHVEARGADRWQFLAADLPPHHLLAVCAERIAGEPPPTFEIAAWPAPPAR